MPRRVYAKSKPTFSFRVLGDTDTTAHGMKTRLAIQSEGVSEAYFRVQVEHGRTKVEFHLFRDELLRLGRTILAAYGEPQEIKTGVEREPKRKTAWALFLEE